MNPDVERLVRDTALDAAFRSRLTAASESSDPRLGDLLDAAHAAVAARERRDDLFDRRDLAEPVSRVLDDGAVGLDFFALFLPSARALGYAGDDETVDGYRRLYDREHAFDLDALVDDVRRLEHGLTRARDELIVQRDETGRLRSAWPDALGTAVSVRAAAAATEFEDAVTTAEDALAIVHDAVATVRKAVAHKAFTVCAQFTPLVGGRTAAEVGDLTALAATEQGGSAARAARVWLDTHLLPEYRERRDAVVAACERCDADVREAMRIAADALTGIEPAPRWRPDGFAVPQPSAPVEYVTFAHGESPVGAAGVSRGDTAVPQAGAAPPMSAASTSAASPMVAAPQDVAAPQAPQAGAPVPPAFSSTPLTSDAAPPPILGARPDATAPGVGGDGLARLIPVLGSVAAELVGQVGAVVGGVIERVAAEHLDGGDTDGGDTDDGDTDDGDDRAAVDVAGDDAEVGSDSPTVRIGDEDWTVETGGDDGALTLGRDGVSVEFSLHLGDDGMPEIDRTDGVSGDSESSETTSHDAESAEPESHEPDPGQPEPTAEPVVAGPGRSTTPAPARGEPLQSDAPQRSDVPAGDGHGPRGAHLAEAGPL